jgi:hypothetical protein
MSSMQQRIATRRSVQGLTVIEFVVMASVVVILALTAFLLYRPVQLNAGFQLEGLRNDLRHMQFLASNWSMPLRLTRTGSSYSVVCTFSFGVAPCATAGDVVNDPTTGQALTVTLASGVTNSATTSFEMDALGRPASGCTNRCTALLSGNTTFTMTGDGKSWTLTVAPVTGFMSVTSP